MLLQSLDRNRETVWVLRTWDYTTYLLTLIINNYLNITLDSKDAEGYFNCLL